MYWCTQELFCSTTDAIHQEEWPLSSFSAIDEHIFTAIYFDLNKSKIRPDAALELDKIVKILNDNPLIYLELGSHTDCRGAEKYNLNLSSIRAKASSDYIKKRIVNPKRITSKGYGESKLKNDCKCEGEIESTCSEEEHQLNRRTEFIILKKK